MQTLYLEALEKSRLLASMACSHQRQLAELLPKVVTSSADKSIDISTWLTSSTNLPFGAVDSVDYLRPLDSVESATNSLQLPALSFDMHMECSRSLSTGTWSTTPRGERMRGRGRSPRDSKVFAKKRGVPVLEGINPVMWMWEHRNGFREYKTNESQHIEDQFRGGAPSVTLKSGKAGTTPMAIFFDEMVQYDPITGNRRRVRRVGPKTVWFRVIRSLNSVRYMMRNGVAARPRLGRLEGDNNICSASSMTGPDLSPWLLRCRQIVRSVWFSLLTSGMILLNLAWLGATASRKDNLAGFGPVEIVIRVLIECLFLIFFATEAALHFMTFRPWWSCTRSSDFLFNAMLTFLMFLDICMLPFQSGEHSGVLRNLAVLRLARLLRMKRLAKVLRDSGLLPELMMMVKGIVRATRSVLVTLLLLVVLLYSFSLIFVQTMPVDCSIAGEFDGMARSIETLILRGVFLDSPSIILRALIEEAPFLGLLFLLFMLLSMMFLSLLVGVLCDVVSHVSAAERDAEGFSLLKQKLSRSIEAHDNDEDGHLDKEEFKLLLRNHEFVWATKQCGVDISAMEFLCETLFEQHAVEKAAKEEDGEGSRTQKISFESLLKVITRFRSEGYATVADIGEVAVYIKYRMDAMERAIRQAVPDASRCLSSRFSCPGSPRRTSSPSATSTTLSPCTSWLLPPELPKSPPSILTPPSHAIGRLQVPVPPTASPAID